MTLQARNWRKDRPRLLLVVVASLMSAECFQFLPSAKVFQKTALSKCTLRLFPFDKPSTSDGERDRRTMEFMNLEPYTETETRRARIERDEEAKEQFAKFGDELWKLRKKMKKLGGKLKAATHGGSPDEEERVRYELREAEKRDPELAYELELLEMEIARREGDSEQAQNAGRRALNARSCLPQYNLEGLWVGKYGSHGYEMINVTYVGDTLIAVKVTGDKNVPRSQISFQADLTPNSVKTIREGRSVKKDDSNEPLEPILLTDKAASKWGTQQLPRYRGLGQVAEEGFRNSRWMDGQLIIIGDDYFSFAWVPLENQIFFGRPSPELALKMLREGGMESLRGKTHWESPPSLDDDVAILKEYVNSCLEKTTETIEEEIQGDPFSCIWHGGEIEECYFE